MKLLPEKSADNQQINFVEWQREIVGTYFGKKNIYEQKKADTDQTLRQEMETAERTLKSAQNKADEVLKHAHEIMDEAKRLINTYEWSGNIPLGSDSGSRTDDLEDDDIDGYINAAEESASAIRSFINKHRSVGGSKSSLNAYWGKRAFWTAVVLQP